MANMPKIGYLDIETAPKLAYVWQFFKANIGVKQVREHGHIMSFSWIWNDDNDDKVIYYENRTQDDVDITAKLLALLDEADVVIGQNSDRFDLPTINGRALVAGLKPPSPYKTVDTCLVARKEFGFPSNSLEYLTTVLKTKHRKLTHAKYPGFELWLACMQGDEEAWKEMREYNIVDTLSVRDVYKAMRPWVRNHANLAVHIESDEHVCPKCGSDRLHRRGYAYTNVGKYIRFQCTDCGGWSRTRYTEYPKEKAKSLLTNAV